MFVPRSHPCSWWSVTLTWHFSGANPTLSSAQGEGAFSAACSAAGSALLSQPCKSRHSPETGALHCHSVKPFGHGCYPAFPGYNKGLLPVPFSFPGWQELGSAGTEQSRRAELSAPACELGACQTFPAKVK